MTSGDSAPASPPPLAYGVAPRGPSPPPGAGAEIGRRAAGQERGSIPPPRHVLSPRLDLARTVLAVVFVFTAGMLAQLTVVGSLQQRSQQQRLYDGFRADLAAGTAPVGPTDIDDRALPVGTAVAYLEIPEIGVRQVVVSGTTAGALFAGPGHRRDSVLPGQAGASVIMGRSAAFGGPFGSIDELEEGDRITVTTGQGEFEFSVLGVRREGDPLPAPPRSDESRLVLTTADGPAFLPHGVLRVDATMEETAAASGGRLFTAERLPASEGVMASDTGQLWALALWLQALVLLSLGSVWAWHRWGRAQAWVVFLPPMLLVGILTANQAARLLPNLV